MKTQTAYCASVSTKDRLEKVTQSEVRRAVNRLNSRPRKGLDYKAPDQLMSDHRAALAA